MIFFIYNFIHLFFDINKCTGVKKEQVTQVVLSDKKNLLKHFQKLKQLKTIESNEI